MLVDKQSELMSDLLFTVHQHGGDDVTRKPPIKSCKAIRVRCVLRGCQPLTHDSEGIIDDIIMHAI